MVESLHVTADVHGFAEKAERTGAEQRRFKRFASVIVLGIFPDVLELPPQLDNGIIIAVMARTIIKVNIILRFWFILISIPLSNGQPHDLCTKSLKSLLRPLSDFKA